MIPVLKPTIDKQTKKELLKVLDSGWWGFGPKTQEFERKFAKYVGAKYCVATNSGTSALDLCLKVYNIKGGELITTPMTFVSDAIVGEWNNMDVTFADIDPDTLCLDPKSLVITKKTKAVITVDSHGRLANIKGIRKKFKGLIIEDAAHAMYTPGAGKDADITIWSFQAVKSLPMWDGGAITTNDEKIYKKLRTLTWLGVEKSTYDRAVGKKYTWDYDITQSQGIKAYMPEIEIPKYSHTVQYYTMKCENRNELSEYLADNGIVTSVHFKPLSKMTYWKKAVKRPLPVNDEVWLKLLTLPVHNALTNKEVKFIIKKVKEFYEG